MNCIRISLLLLIPVLSCVQREEGMGSRHNPFDPGGDNWIVDARPEVSVGFDSLWADFNHADSTGTIGLLLTISDRNFPFDTVIGTVSMNDRQISLPPIWTFVDTMLPVDRLKAASVSRCKSAI